MIETRCDQILRGAAAGLQILPDERPDLLATGHSPGPGVKALLERLSAPATL